MAKVSILLPCYRMQGYLARAIQSLFVQTESDWEAVVVSDDGIDYQQVLRGNGVSMDKRLRFTSTGKVGGGLSNARNCGLESASSELIALLDPDDTYDPTYLRTMLDPAKVHGAALSNIEVFPIDRSLPTYNPVIQESSGAIALQNAWRIANSTNVSIVFDRTRVRQKWFTEITCFEDVLFTHGCYDFLQQIWFSAAPLYQYRLREGSLSWGPHGSERFIRTKSFLMKACNNGTIPIKSPVVRGAFAAFLDVSLRTEIEFAERLGCDPDVQFTSLLVDRFVQEGWLGATQPKRQYA